MSEFNTTGNPQPAGNCFLCGGMIYVGLTHSCTTGGQALRFTTIGQAKPPREVWLHIHKDGRSASTACPDEECLFGRRVRYVLAE